jgi:acetyl esterase/lipase
LKKGGEDGQLADELRVSGNVPPTFFIHAANDPVTAESSLFYYLALNRAKVPAEMHLFAEGGHGYGMARAKELPVGSWPVRLAEWIRWVTRAP